MANVVQTLKHIAHTHRHKLMATFALVAAENLLFVLYPLVGSFAVNAVLAGDTTKALAYAFMVFVMWAMGAARRAVDTRAFVRIYASLAVPAILNQKQKGTTSKAIAHANLARQFVDFFETHLPVLITAGFNIVGSVIMLIIIEFWVGIISLVILLIFISILPKYTKMNNRLYFKLNNHIENQGNVIGRGRMGELVRHYDLLSKIRIGISNREAMSFFVIGVSLAVLFGATLAILANKTVQAGHVYAVITYLWAFAMSIDDMPRFVEKFSELKDIGTRVQV